VTTLVFLYTWNGFEIVPSTPSEVVGTNEKRSYNNRIWTLTGMNIEN